MPSPGNPCLMVLDDIRNFPPDKKAILIIRHAERYTIDEIENVHLPLLTEKGKRDSFQFGRDLSKIGEVRLFHSPVMRCQETAVEISRGLNESGNEAAVAGHALELGGPFIAGDWKDIAAEIKRHGYREFVRMWFDGKVSEKTIMPLGRSAILTTEFFLRQYNDSDTFIINVTHDWNLMILREHYFGLRHEDLGLPDFLDGMIFYVTGRKAMLMYHGEERAVT